MSEVSGEDTNYSPTSSVGKPGDHYANADKTESIVVSIKEANNRIVGQSVHLEVKGLPPKSPPHVVKDGGLIAWSTVLGAWCMLFCTFGLTNSYGVYQDYYVRVHLSNYAPSTIGWIGSFQVFLEFGAGLTAGMFFDKGYFYHMAYGASFLFLLSNFLLSFCKPQQFYQVFLAQGIGAGISLGFLFLPSLSILSHHFARKRALAMGIASSGSSCGGVVFPILINHMITKYGFVWATRIAAFLCLALMAISLACMRTCPPPPRPQAEGQKPPSVLDILKDVPYVLAVLAAFVEIIGIFFLTFHLQLYAIQEGVNRNLAFYAITILNGASILGRILPNFLADFIGVYNIVIISTFTCGVITLATLAVDTTAGIICLAVFYGFSSGAYIGLIGPLFASLSRSINEVGLRIGLAFTVLSVGGLMGGPIEGALLTGSFHWAPPIIFSSVCFFVATTGLSISRMLHVRRKGTWKV